MTGRGVGGDEEARAMAEAYDWIVASAALSVWVFDVAMIGK